METKAIDNAIAAFGGKITKIGAGLPAAKKKATPDRERIDFGTEMDHLAALKLVSKALENVAKLIETQQKSKALKEIAATAFRIKGRPDTFIGCGPRTTAYVSLSKKGSNVALDEETLRILDELGVPVDKQEKVPARLVINPVVLGDQRMIEALARAVQSVPELEGIDVVLQQEAQFHYSTNDATIDMVARKAESEAQLLDLLGRVSTVSIGKFQIDKLDNPEQLMNEALGIIKGANLLTEGAA